MTKTYEIELSAPEQGHFWAQGPLPLDAPDILTGEHGVTAYRVDTLGEHNALYAVEGYGEMLSQKTVTLTAPEVGDVTPAHFALHPYVVDDLAALLGRARVGDFWSEKPEVMQVLDSPARRRYLVTHDTGEGVWHCAFDVFSRSPVVQVAGFFATKDRQTAHGAHVSLKFGEEVILHNAHMHPGLKVNGGEVSGVIDIDRGAVYPVRFSLLCRAQSKAGEVVDALSDLSAQALEAAREGPFWFMPTKWDAEWLGAVPAVNTDAGQVHALNAFDGRLSAGSVYDKPCYASYPAASQGGSQNSLSLSWYAPVFVPMALQPHQSHLHAADDWALRPMFLFEPGTDFPMSSFGERRATTASRQVHEFDWIGDQKVPRFQTKGEILANIGGGRTDRRAPPDMLHVADGPLLAAYAMTGDYVCRWMIEGIREVELAQRNVFGSNDPKYRWRSNGRGEGRMGSWLLAGGKLIGGEQFDRVKAHLIRRLENAVLNADTSSLPEDAPSRPIELYGDKSPENRLKCQQPCLIPYEESQIAWVLWRLYQETGDTRALAGAYRWGVTTAAQLYRRGSQWSIPYACSQMPDGSALTTEQLNDLRYVHPNGPDNWSIAWSGAGLRALLFAVAEDPSLVRPGHAEFVDRARAAVEEMDAAGLTKIEEIHQSLAGTPIAPKPIAD